MEHAIIPTLAILFDDKEVTARKNAHKTVEMVSELPYGKLILYDFWGDLEHRPWASWTLGADAINQLKLIKTLVEKLKTEVDDIKVSFALDWEFCR